MIMDMGAIMYLYPALGTEELSLGEIQIYNQILLTNNSAEFGLIYDFSVRRHCCADCL